MRRGKGPNRPVPLKAGVIVVAAGVGKRLGGAVEKPYVLLGGRPLIWHCLSALQKCGEVREIVLVLREGCVNQFRKKWQRRFSFSKIRAIVPGGKTRQASVAAGLKVLSGEAPIVVVHDAARPFITAAMVRAVAGVAAEGLGATVGVPVTQTIKKVDDAGHVVNTPARKGLWEIQTPQAFPRALLEAAHQAALRDGIETTDDAGLVERHGAKVRVILGSRANLKITTPVDLLLAQMLHKRLSQ